MLSARQSLISRGSAPSALPCATHTPPTTAVGAVVVVAEGAAAVEAVERLVAERLVVVVAAVAHRHQLLLPPAAAERWTKRARAPVRRHGECLVVSPTRRRGAVSWLWSRRRPLSLNEASCCSREELPPRKMQKSEVPGDRATKISKVQLLPRITPPNALPPPGVPGLRSAPLRRCVGQSGASSVVVGIIISESEMRTALCCRVRY